MQRGGVGDDAVDVEQDRVVETRIDPHPLTGVGDPVPAPKGRSLTMPSTLCHAVPPRRPGSTDQGLLAARQGTNSPARRNSATLASPAGPIRPRYHWCTTEKERNVNCGKH